MSESWVNAVHGSQNKIDLGGVDEVVCVLARAMIQAVKADRSVVLVLSDGTELTGTLHHSLSIEDAKSLVGRTLDLADAYKQLLVRKSHQWTQVLQIFNLEAEKWELFLNSVLPFGASGSVLGFNRYSRAIWLIGVVHFDLIWTIYFDDYPMLDIEASGNASQICAEELLDLLGCCYSCKEHKRKTMEKDFEA